MLAYFCAYLDRMNVGMAALTMNHQLGFSSAVFGFGAGLFFLGYCLAEIPSNLVLNVVGARSWFARILITWGVFSGLTAFVWNDWSFYCIRLLLGLAEAGFFPGVVLYLTWWFPSAYRGRAMAIFYSASMVSLIIGPPIGGLLLQMNGFLGLAGWQWLFVLEALPAIVMCFVVWFLLTDRPKNATWLTLEQRTWLQGRLDSEQKQRETIRKFSLIEVFYDPKMCLLTLAYVGQNMAAYGMFFFLPQIVKGLGVSTNWIGTVSGLPFVFALFTLNYWGWHSDRTGERVWHVVIPWLLTTFGMAACIFIGTSHPVMTMAALIVALAGNQALPAIFWSLPAAFLTGSAAAGGIAMISAVGSLGGWLGPWVYGLLKDLTGSDNIALLCLAAAPIISSIAVLLAGHDRRTERIPPRA
jgi:MFS family permease